MEKYKYKDVFRTRNWCPTPERQHEASCYAVGHHVAPLGSTGRWFYLYMILDLCSRKITGYEAHEAKSGEQAVALLQRSVIREDCWRQPLVLHSDNGAAMKSQTLQMKLHELNITPSHSRPWVHNDKVCVESLFRRLKYVPQWPSSRFST